MSSLRRILKVILEDLAAVSELRVAPRPFANCLSVAYTCRRAGASRRKPCIVCPRYHSVTARACAHGRWRSGARSAPSPARFTVRRDCIANLSCVSVEQVAASLILQRRAHLLCATLLSLSLFALAFPNRHSSRNGHSSPRILSRSETRHWRWAAGAIGNRQ